MSHHNTIPRSLCLFVCYRNHPTALVSILLTMVLFYCNSIASTSHHPTRLVDFCPSNDQPGIVNGNHNRLVGEGGRLALTCCLKVSRPSEEEDQQLAWVDPRGSVMVNYFTNPSIGPKHFAYTIPDYRWADNYLMSVLIVQKFRPSDAGSYSCQLAQNTSGDLRPVDSFNSINVTLDLRPRLLADYLPLPPPADDDGSALAIGEPVSKGLELDRSGQLTCRINPSFRSGLVRITWFFQGRQLVRPSSIQYSRLRYSAPQRDRQSADRSQLITGSDDRRGNKSRQHNRRSTQYRSLLTNTAANDDGGRNHFKTVWIDPDELGVQLMDDGQILRFPNVTSRHAGQYLCKAEAPNPDWSANGRVAAFVKTDHDRGSIESSVLIQLQPIRAVVFSRPRLLPGNPVSLVPPSDHLTSLLTSQNQRPDKASSTIEALAREGGQLMLECSARGQPPPQLVWYRGGQGSFPLTSKQALTFDQRVREALNHLTLADVEHQLGVKIARNDQLTPEVADNNSESSTFEQGNSSRLLGNRWASSRRGRFELYHRLGPDAVGNPVISVSRLVINNVEPSDATRYTCLASLDLKRFGGSDNYTDFGSVLPDVIFRPRFVRHGTRLHVESRPNRNVTLTCEAYGGKLGYGLQLRLLRGNGVLRLFDLLRWSGDGSLNDNTSYLADIDQVNSRAEPSSLDITGASSSTTGNDRKEWSPVYTPHDLDQQRRVDEMVPLTPWSPQSLASSSQSVPRLIDIEVMQQTRLDPRYNLTVSVDRVNPYASILRLEIRDLLPEDNAYYACEAVTGGGQWRSISPTGHEAPGRLTVWFAPTNMSYPDAQQQHDSSQQDNIHYRRPPPPPVTYGLAHLTSKLTCQVYGQPRPTWTWFGPQSGSDAALGQLDDLIGYIQHDYQDGEAWVSELLVPASFWNADLFGTYTCKAGNSFGNISGHLQLKLATHPGKPRLDACRVETNLIELCVAPPESSGGLPMTHYELRMQTELKGKYYGPFFYQPGPRALRLTDLLTGQYYRFALSAASGAGRGPNAYLTVETDQIRKPTFELGADNATVESQAFTLHWTVEKGHEDEGTFVVRLRPTSSGSHLPTGQSINDWKEFKIDYPNCTVHQTGDKNCSFRMDHLRPDKSYQLSLEQFKDPDRPPVKQSLQFHTASWNNEKKGVVQLTPNAAAALKGSSSTSSGGSGPRIRFSLQLLLLSLILIVLLTSTRY